MLLGILITIQLILLFVLPWRGFAVATGELLTIFVPLVWTAVGTVAGAIIYLFRIAKVQTSSGNDSDAVVSKQVVKMCVYIMICTLIFIVLSALYPARVFIQNNFNFVVQYKDLLKSIYDSLLIVLFGVPCLASAFVGAWIFYLEIEKK